MLASALILGGVAAIVLLWPRPRAAAGTSLTGVWQEVGGGETLEFSGDGDLKINSAAGRYAFIDGTHIEIYVPNGTPRFASYSCETGDITWTNGRGMVLRYAFRPLLSLKNRIR